MDGILLPNTTDSWDYGFHRGKGVLSNGDQTQKVTQQLVLYVRLSYFVFLLRLLCNLTQEGRADFVYVGAQEGYKLLHGFVYLLCWCGSLQRPVVDHLRNRTWGSGVPPPQPQLGCMPHDPKLRSGGFF